METAVHFIMRSALRVAQSILCVSWGDIEFWGSNFNYMDVPENGRCNDRSVNERHYDTAGKASVALQRESAEQTPALLWRSD